MYIYIFFLKNVHSRTFFSSRTALISEALTHAGHGALRAADSQAEVKGFGFELPWERITVGRDR